MGEVVGLWGCVLYPLCFFLCSASSFSECSACLFITRGESGLVIIPQPIYVTTLLLLLISNKMQKNLLCSIAKIYIFDFMLLLINNNGVNALLLTSSYVFQMSRVLVGILK